MRAADKIRAKLPSWFRMRHDPNSVGWQLIDVIGQGIDEAGRLTDYVSASRYLATVSKEQLSLCFAAHLPRTCFESGNQITIMAEGRVIRLVDDLGEFLLSCIPELNVPHLYQHDIGYLDRGGATLYVQKRYNASAEHPDGWVSVQVTGKQGKVVATLKLSLSARPLWTTLDELGILVSTPRLPEEDNESYWLRLMAAARLPGDASKEGYIRGLARELGLLKKYTWADGGRDFLIPHRHVNPETILVDWKRPRDEEIITGPNGQLAIAGSPEYAGIKRIVVYAYGIKVHDLSDNADPYVQSMLYDKEGFPTREAVELKNRLDKLVPVKWDHFVWGDAFWDGGSYALLPNMYDAKTGGFESEP